MVQVTDGVRADVELHANLSQHQGYIIIPHGADPEEVAEVLQRLEDRGVCLEDFEEHPPEYLSPDLNDTTRKLYLRWR